MGETVREDQLAITIAMNKDISLVTFLFQDDLGVPTIETTPIQSRISLS